VVADELIAVSLRSSARAHRRQTANGMQLPFAAKRLPLATLSHRRRLRRRPHLPPQRRPRQWPSTVLNR
jgi:hypothetical protein